jgi:hypothetical protein
MKSFVSIHPQIVEQKVPAGVIGVEDLQRG